MSRPNETPAFSIIIPAYKAAQYLPATLESIAAQTVKNWELLICEDGCYDDTAAIVERFTASVTQPVHFIRHAQNLGVSLTRNHLIDKAQGVFLAFVDADDLWDQDHLEKALSALSREAADWSIGAVRFIDSEAQDLGLREIPPLLAARDIPNALLRHNFVIPSATVVRRALFKDSLRFNASFPIGEDLDVWITLVKNGIKPVFQTEPSASYRRHPSSATADVIRFPEEFSRVFEKWLGDPVVDTGLCREEIIKMLRVVVKMTWRKQPARGLEALKRLRRIGYWSWDTLLQKLLCHCTQVLSGPKRLSGPR